MRKRRVIAGLLLTACLAMVGCGTDKNVDQLEYGGNLSK